MFELTRDDIRAIARNRVSKESLIKWLWIVWYIAVGGLGVAVIMNEITLSTIRWSIPYIDWVVLIGGAVGGVALFTISGVVVYKTRKLFKVLEGEIKARKG